MISGSIASSGPTRITSSKIILAERIAAVVEVKEEVEVAEDVCINGDDKKTEEREGEADVGGGGVLVAFVGGDDHDAWGLAEVLRLADVLEEAPIGAGTRVLLGSLRDFLGLRCDGEGLQWC
ncbi:solute carrier family 12 member 1 [Striga asiatica]|uniref:Solute carrier family 12 member 1 n=1 Tax=Striga asiatica TaxID=4170 RepID=A0A5A7RHG0_STRAF|nr:solute carrier family 12 member 1 [Striga asiatica]